MTKDDFKSFIETFSKVVCGQEIMRFYKDKGYYLVDDEGGVYLFHQENGKMVVGRNGTRIHTPGVLIDKISVWFATFKSGTTKMCINLKSHGIIIFSTSFTDNYGQADYDLMKAVADRYNAEDEEEEGSEA